MYALSDRECGKIFPTTVDRQIVSITVLLKAPFASHMLSATKVTSYKKASAFLGAFVIRIKLFLKSSHTKLTWITEK